MPQLFDTALSLNLCFFNVAWNFATVYPKELHLTSMYLDSTK